MRQKWAALRVCLLFGTLVRVMPELESKWYCTLCKQEFGVEPQSNPGEIRCPLCMKKTGLVAGGASRIPGKPGGAHTKKQLAGAASGRSWLVAVVGAVIVVGGAAAALVWTLLEPQEGSRGLPELLQRPVVAEAVGLPSDKALLSTCNSLEGFQQLLEGFEPPPTGEDSLQSEVKGVSALLEQRGPALPVEILALGLACLNEGGSFAAPCRRKSVGLTEDLNMVPAGLCTAEGDAVGDAAIWPPESGLEPGDLVIMGYPEAVAWLLASKGATAAQPAKAYELFAEAMELAALPQFRFQLGEAKYRFKLPDFAAEDMAKALSAGFDAAGATRLAELLSRLGRWSEALEIYNRIVRESGSTPEVTLGQARAYLSMGRLAEAEPLLNQLAKSSPGLPGLNQVLAAWHLSSKRYDEGLAALKAEYDLRPSKESALGWLRALEATKGSEAALETLKQIDIGGMEISLERLRLHLVRDEKQEAVALARELSGSYPEEVLVRRASGMAFMHAGEFPEAEEAFAAAERLEGNTGYETLTYLTIARFQMEAKGLKPKESAMATLAKLEERNGEARLDVGLSLEGLGLWTQARDLFEEGLRGNKGRNDMAIALYGLYLRNGDPEKAAKLRNETLAAVKEAERVGLEAGFQHEYEAVQKPDQTPTSASTPEPVRAH